MHISLSCCRGRENDVALKKGLNKNLRFEI